MHKENVSSCVETVTVTQVSDRGKVLAAYTLLAAVMYVLGYNMVCS
jgi:hypothetical protein